MRLIGLLLLYRAFAVVLGFMIADFSYPSGPSGVSDPAFTSLVAMTLIPGLCGVYLMFFGKGLHRILMREAPVVEGDTESPYLQPVRTMRKGSWMADSVKDEEPRDPETTLTDREAIEFSAWLHENEAVQKRPLPDQIALFRDFQIGRGSDK